MTDDQINFIFANYNNVAQERFRNLFRKDFHIDFEKADMQNDIKFFANLENDKTMKDFCETHVESTKGVFEFENYKDWVQKKRLKTY